VCSSHQRRPAPLATRSEPIEQEEHADGSITLRSAAEILHRSRQAANEAIAHLAQAGVLRATTIARRNRAWEARELFDLVDAMERELARPDDAIAPRRPGPRGRRARSATK